MAVYSVESALVSGFVLSCSSHRPTPSVFVRETPSLESPVHHSRRRRGNFKHIAEAKVQHIPTDIIMIPERLLRKDHDRTGVDWQGQPVVQIHVLQPVVVHLNENTGIVKQFLFSTQVITLRVGTCVQRRKKPLQCITARWNEELGESRRGSGSLIDFTELDELWTEWSARRRGERLRRRRMSRGSDKSLSPGDSTLLGMGYMLCLRRDLMEVFIHFFFFFF